jgi:hypothetical protein
MGKLGGVERSVLRQLKAFDSRFCEAEANDQVGFCSSVMKRNIQLERRIVGLFRTIER